MTKPECRRIDDDVLLTSEPRDRRIARLLWIWARDPNRILADGRNVQRHISDWLESFLCDSFAYSSEGAKDGWWSDGILDLHIDHFSATAFLVFGSTWWAGHNVAKQSIGPFEIEFYFNGVGNLDFARTIVRFGLVDENGNIKRSSCSLHPRIRNNGRAIRNSDWAMAIELSLPENAEEN